MGYPRLGHINFLNCLPLTYSLRHDGYAKGLDITWGVPAVLNNDIVNHRLDVSQVSSIIYARHSRELVLLPDVCIRSEGAVESILLVSRKPIEDIRNDKIILTAKSATSHCLLKIIMTEQYGASPNYFVRHVGPANPIPEDAAAALVIGDDALYVYHHQQNGLYYYDIGTEWTKLTGQFMVYAVWVADKKFVSERHDMLQLIYDRVIRGFANGLRKKDAAIRSVVPDKPFTFAQLSEYLEVIKWDLGDSQLEGLRTFYRLAYGMGLIPFVPNLEIADVRR